MIYEVRTYDLKPGAVPQAEEAFAEALPHREKYSPIAAFWHTEIGPLNQIIHVWGYEDMAERNRIRAEAGQDPNWPPKITPGNILNMNSEIWNPASFMRPMGGDQALGNIYEMRVYTYENGAMPELLRRWEESLPYREEFSPLAAGMFTEFGDLNKWMHVWPLPGPEPPGRGSRRRQQDTAVAVGRAGSGKAGEQDNDPGQLLADALRAAAWGADGYSPPTQMRTVSVQPRITRGMRPHEFWTFWRLIRLRKARYVTAAVWLRQMVCASDVHRRRPSKLRRGLLSFPRRACCQSPVVSASSQGPRPLVEASARMPRSFTY